ncbi:GNAT family N-acetyltransferase [Undibacterium arcticum]|uniref:GNAT family N-acetyltransferase n=1 Tax=Undibacterium arcticum TaxID=1762892 RepID=UPI00361EF2D1
MESEEISISLYENEVPAFVEAELERLYENIFSSLEKFRVEGTATNASTYVVRKGAEVITVFLFRRENGKVEVLNQAIKIEEVEVCRFADAIFSAFKSVTVITFHAVQTTIRKLPFPYQRFNCLEDIVLTLPNTSQQYLASLGKNMRRNIKRYMSKLTQSFPSFCYEVYEKEEASEQHIRDIIRLSSARMAVKKKVTLHNEEKTERLIRLVRRYGFVGVVTIDGRVCAGLIGSHCGANYASHVVAHASEYDDYMVGMLCYYLTICECIDRDFKEFHFLWGRSEYKYKLLGVQRDLDHLAVYRSRAQFLLNGDMVLKNAFKGYGRQAKRWLLDPKRTDSLIGRVAIRIADSM